MYVYHLLAILLHELSVIFQLCAINAMLASLAVAVAAIIKNNDDVKYRLAFNA